MPGKAEEELTAALEKWREAASLAWLSPALQDFHGGAAVLSNKVLKIIVRCAANGKIKSIEDLRRETQWSRANKYGAEVLDLIKDLLPYHFRDDPPPPPPSPPPPPLGDSTGLLNHAGARVVGFFRCCEACCMIFDDLSQLAHPMSKVSASAQEIMQQASLIMSSVLLMFCFQFSVTTQTSWYARAG